LILVKGVAIVKEIPEIIAVTINVKTESPNYKTCQEQMEKLISKTKRIFVTSGISADLIKMNGIRVTEKIEYSKGERINNGYLGAASFGIESTFSTDFTSKILTALKNDSIVITYSIEFKLSESQKAKVRQKAVELAIADAKEKAKLIAEASNVILLKINSIDYKNEDSGRDSEYDIISKDNWISREIYLGSAGRKENTEDLNPKEIGIQKSVQMKWIIKEK
jgi:uncharacterized protein YggE